MHRPEGAGRVAESLSPQAIRLSALVHSTTRTMSKRHLIAAFAAFVPGLALALLLSGPAAAQAIERLSDHRDWSAFRYKEDGESVCYMASSPKQAEGDYSQRGDIFAIVTHRPASNRVGEISISAGYTYKDKSTVRVKIGSKTWDLFTDGSSAWAPTATEDKAILKAMRAGSSMVVKGTSARGTLTTDTYSLLGFSKALGAINSACGL
jgi:invasion protein IalB